MYYNHLDYYSVAIESSLIYGKKKHVLVSIESYVKVYSRGYVKI